MYIYKRANGIYIPKSCIIWTVCPCFDHDPVKQKYIKFYFISFIPDGFFLAENSNINNTAVRPESFVNFHIATRYIKMNKTSLAYSTYVTCVLVLFLILYVQEVRIHFI